MARKFQNAGNNGAGGTGKVLLLVDDNLEYLEATKLVLEHEGHTVITADNGMLALSIIRERHIDLLLLDFFMPGMTGEEVILELRKFDTKLQVILQTGYASECPPRELLKRLDIQGYFDKSEGPEKLLLWTDVGLKAAYSTQLLEKSRKGLSYILSAAPELYKIQPIEDLLQGILLQVSGLLDTANSFLTVIPVQAQGITVSLVQGFLVILDEERHGLRIRAGVGKFSTGMKLDDALGEEKRILMEKALAYGNVITEAGVTLVPLMVGEMMVGLVYLENEIVNVTDIELLRVFANQAAVAIQNTQLYEMATMDPLTGAFVRRFFNQWMHRSLKSALRSRKPVGLVMIDMDNMKAINDSAGHLVGDQALIALTQVLKESTRSSDYIGRFGGDEFTLLLPETPVDGVVLVVSRILQKLSVRTVMCNGEPITLKASLGISVLTEPTILGENLKEEYWSELGKKLQKEADESMYEAKNSGKNKAGPARVIRWPEP